MPIIQNMIIIKIWGPVRVVGALLAAPLFG
jgi:hypothetical protein